VLDAGRIIAQGTPEELRHANGDVTLRLKARDPLRLMNWFSGNGGGQLDGRGWLTRDLESVDDSLELLSRLRGQGIELESFSLDRPTLEDAFIRLTGQRLGPGWNLYKRSAPMRAIKLARDTKQVFVRSLRQAKRSPIVAFIFPVLFPMFMLTIMSQLYGDITRVLGFPTGSYTAWMAPSVFLMSAMFGAGYSATGLVMDIQSGYLDRLRLLPVHPASLMLGRLLFDVLRVSLGGVVVPAASVAMGARLSGGLAGIPAMLLLLALWTLAYGGMFYLVGLRSKNPRVQAVLVPMFLPISMLSTAFVPREFMPAWISAASSFNPYTYVVEGVRMFMTGSVTWVGFGFALAAALSVVFVSHFLAGRSFAALVRGD
jgi:ABC-2 type transport system permease protein